MFHAYFVVDLAGDMKMVANLQEAFERLGDTLDISEAYDIGRFSLITYNNVAQTAVPSCSPREFQVPDLAAHRSSKHSLGAAYELLAEERQKEVKPGDSGAMVFTLLNGTPTDDWEQSANRVKELFGPYSIMIDQSGDVNASEMLKATRFKEVYRMKGSETKDYDNLIKTLGSTIDQTSTRNTSMGHTIQAEENEPAKASEPVLSIIGDTLLPL